MAMPTDIGVVDTMLDLPYRNRDWAKGRSEGVV